MNNVADILPQPVNLNSTAILDLNRPEVGTRCVGARLKLYLKAEKVLEIIHANERLTTTGRSGASADTLLCSICTEHFDSPG
jgi:hypothetical protein